jgi:uncharacterized membrane protein YjfL (UPF0719 family)
VAAATSDFDNDFDFKESDMGVQWLNATSILGSVLFALIGVIVFWLSFVIIDKMTPYSLWTELVDKQNVALGIVVGAMSLGISIIVAAAIH